MGFIKRFLFYSMLALYGVFLSLDIFAPDWYFLSNLFKYAFMIWVFLFALSAQAKKESPAMKTALGITLVCDFLLLFTQYQTLGVSLFCLVQMIYISISAQKKGSICLYWSYCCLLLFYFPAPIHLSITITLAVSLCI